MLIFSIIRFHFSFQIFFFIYKFTIKLFFDTIFNFFPKSYFVFLINHHLLSEKTYISVSMFYIKIGLLCSFFQSIIFLFFLKKKIRLYGKFTVSNYSGNLCSPFFQSNKYFVLYLWPRFCKFC